jgi:hypothetical protein
MRSSPSGSELLVEEAAQKTGTQIGLSQQEKPAESASGDRWLIGNKPDRARFIPPAAPAQAPPTMARDIAVLKNTPHV